MLESEFGAWISTTVSDKFLFVWQLFDEVGKIEWPILLSKSLQFWFGLIGVLFLLLGRLKEGELCSL